jgi:hypothetical protein
MAEIIVEAALNSPDGSEGFFFLADHYVVYDWVTDRVKNGVHPTSSWGFPAGFSPVGPGAGLDAALTGKPPHAGKLYFFRGSEYTRVNWNPRVMETPTPPALSLWALAGKLSAGVDAALNGRFSREGKAYFFKDSKYARYTWSAEQGDTTAPNGQPYPRPISEMMSGMGDFANGVDGAIDGGTGYEEYGYLFRKDRYLRINWNAGPNPAVSGSDDIQPKWPGLVELLFAGKAKAQALQWIGAAAPRLSAYAAFLTGGPVPADQALIEAALSAHFRISPNAPAASKVGPVGQILTGYASVVSTLATSPTIFRFRTDAEAAADGQSGVRAYTTLNANMNFTRLFAQVRKFPRAAIVLHEAVHVFDAQSHSVNATNQLTVDIPEWYVTQAAAPGLGLPPQADNSGLATRYDLLPTADAVHNPSSYSAFAQHIANNADTRYGALVSGPE